MIRKILIALLIALVIIQFFHPAKNKHAVLPDHSIAALYPVPPAIKEILAVSCNDCHSNNTVYPWYSKLQPVDWWLNDHVKDGKSELNFDEFATYNLRRQYHKLEEVIDQVKKGEMPLNSYTWIHKDAILSAAQQQEITAWANGIRTSMEGKYPMDSLVRKKQAVAGR